MAEAAQQPGLMEQVEVVADRRLGQVEGVIEVARAESDIGRH